VGELAAIILRETAQDKTSLLFDNSRGSKTFRDPAEILITDPLESEALLPLGDKYMVLDDIDSAIQIFDRAIELNPGHEELWTRLADAFKAQKKKCTK
jgi:tetratricopeptide (TPR) repeat protein